MIFRNMFKKIFNKNPTYTDGKNLTRFLSLNNSVNLFAAADKKIYQNLFARTCIHAIAENGAKLKPKVIRVQGGRQVMANRPKLQRLLDLQPNEYMNTFDFLYKVITLLYIDNNVFIYIKRNDYSGEVEGLYPINYSSSEVLEAGGIMYVRFTFFTGFTMVCAYDELVHLRRFYGEDDLFGANEKALTKHIGLLNILDTGLAASAAAPSEPGPGPDGRSGPHLAAGGGAVSAGLLLRDEEQHRRAVHRGGAAGAPLPFQ